MASEQLSWSSVAGRHWYAGCQVLRPLRYELALDPSVRAPITPRAKVRPLVTRCSCASRHHHRERFVDHARSSGANREAEIRIAIAVGSKRFVEIPDPSEEVGPDHQSSQGAAIDFATGQIRRRKRIAEMPNGRTCAVLPYDAARLPKSPGRSDKFGADHSDSRVIAHRTGQSRDAAGQQHVLAVDEERQLSPSYSRRVAQCGGGADSLTERHHTHARNRGQIRRLAIIRLRPDDDDFQVR